MSDHEYAAAFRGMIHSHILMPRYQQDTLMRSGFSRFWQCRFATTLQIGNAQMIDRWLRRQHDGSTTTPPPTAPADLAQMVADWSTDDGY